MSRRHRSASPDPLERIEGLLQAERTARQAADEKLASQQAVTADAIQALHARITVLEARLTRRDNPT